MIFFDRNRYLSCAYSLIMVLSTAGCGDDFYVPLVLGETISATTFGHDAPIVIDTDLTNEIDDEFALVYALRSELNIRGVYAAPYSLSPQLVAGGAVSELALNNYRETLAEFELDLDAIETRLPAPGVQRAFDAAEDLVALVGGSHPTDGIFVGADRFLENKDDAILSDAAQHLIALLRDNERVIVVANAALTNIASVVNTAPELSGKMTVIWTGAYPSYWPYENASFNLAQDPDAVRVVFESDAEVIYIPGYFVAEKLVTNLPEIEEKLLGKGPDADKLYWLYEDHPLFGSHDTKTKVLWDLAGISWLTSPQHFLTKRTQRVTLGDDWRWEKLVGRSYFEVSDVLRDDVFKGFYGSWSASIPQED